MIIKSIELNNFRNYENLNISFEEGINILYGNNAQGKTNLLEAAYFSGTSKSHKTAKDKELIKFDKEEAHIKTCVKKGEDDLLIDIHLKKNRPKGIAINKSPIKKVSDLFGNLNIVFFSPEDLNIIKESPTERRRFIDQELCQIDRIYLHNLTNYNKALAQRNKLLKDINFHPSLKETLSVWDDQLVNFGKNVISKRSDFINELSKIVSRIHTKITGIDTPLVMIYEKNIEPENFSEELIKNHDKDLRFENTSVGPHRDDISFYLDGIDIRKFGSQGQQRTVALCLKLAEIEIVKKTIGDNPVLLLDDVMSELDSSRQSFLLENINTTQTIITCTGIDDFIRSRCNIDKVFYVTNGIVTEEK